MTDQIEVIPYRTKEAQKAIDMLIDDTKQEMQDIEDMKGFLSFDTGNISSMSYLPRTDDFLDRWWEISKPDQEYEFFQDRLDDLMEEHNLPKRVYADMYDEFTLLPQYEEAAEAVVNSLQQNDRMTPQLAGQLNQFMEYSQAARNAQLEDFHREQQRLQHYTEELDEIVEGFEEMNQHQLPFSVDRAQNYWDNLESFDERVERMRTERDDDYDGEDYNAANLYGFLNDFYGAEIDVRQPVRSDLDAVESRTSEAKDNIVI